MMTDLREILVWVTTAGAGVLAYWLIDNVAWLAQLAPRAKRFAAMALTGAIALAAWGVQLAMAYVPAPVDWRGWVEAAVAIVAVAFAVSQGIHGARNLSSTRA